MPTLQELLGSLGGLGANRQVPQMPVNAQTPPFMPPQQAAPPMAPPAPQMDPFAILMSLGQQQAQPEAPKTKRQQIGMAIGDFLTSIGAGLSNRGKAGQSTGAGAAMQTPFILQQQRQQQAQQQQMMQQAQQKLKYDQMLQAINARMTQDKLGLEQKQEARLAQGAPPQPFNLGPGQTRFGPDGKPLVSVPATPAAPQPGFNLGPGQTRFGPDGKPIASIPATPETPTVPAPRNIDPNSPEGIAARLKFEQEKAKLDAAKPEPGASPYAAERAARTVQSVDELLGKVNGWTTAYGAALFDRLPATEARNFKAQLDTLKANIAFNELTAMREASKTGGALGQVSNIELNLLQSALGALDTGQKPAELKAQLNRIKESVQRWQKATSGNGAAKQNPFRK